MQFHTTVQLGRTREVTPEGFLLCRDVRIARTGVQTYGPGEVPVQPGPDGMVYIEREEAEVFRDATLASINGKPIVNSHPDEDVTPDNWRDHAIGSAMNCRRGEGENANYTVADLLFTDRSGISAVNAGKTEISLGYNAAYDQIAPGRGRQRNIIVNHIALEDKGRCGPACAIGDSAMSPFKTWLDKLTAAKTPEDVKALLAESPEPAGGGVTINVAGKTTDSEAQPTLDARMKVLEDGQAAILKLLTKDAEKEKDDDEDDDEKKDKAKDRAAVEAVTADEMTTFAASVEILSPGFKIPTLDAKADPAKTRDHLCTCKRKALATAYATEDGKRSIDPFLAGKEADFDNLPARTVDIAFDGAAAMLGALNNRDLIDWASKPASGKTADANANTIAAVSDANKKFWEARKAGA